MINNHIYPEEITDVFSYCEEFKGIKEMLDAVDGLRPLVMSVEIEKNDIFLVMTCVTVINKL